MRCAYIKLLFIPMSCAYATPKICQQIQQLLNSLHCTLCYKSSSITRYLSLSVTYCYSCFVGFIYIFLPYHAISFFLLCFLLSSISLFIYIRFSLFLYTFSYFSINILRTESCYVYAKESYRLLPPFRFHFVISWYSF